MQIKYEKYYLYMVRG